MKCENMLFLNEGTSRKRTFFFLQYFYFMTNNTLNILFLFQIFRLLQGEVEANQMRVLQMAEESSLDTAVAWYERSIMRQQLQDTFLGHTGLDTWDQAKEAFPAHTTEIETLVGKLSRRLTR